MNLIVKSHWLNAGFVAQAADDSADLASWSTTIRIVAGVALVGVLIYVFLRVKGERKKEQPRRTPPRYIYRCRGLLFSREEEMPFDGLSAFDSLERLLAHTWIYKKGMPDVVKIDIERLSLLQASYDDERPASGNAAKRQAMTGDSASRVSDIESDEFPQGEKRGWDAQVQMLIERDKAGAPGALKSLMQWGKGCSWPGGRRASEYLLSVGRRAYPLVLDVLGTQDDEWKYRVITGLVYNWPRELQEEIAPVLETLTRQPTEERWNVEVDVAAAEVLCENKLLDQRRLTEIVGRVLGNNPNLDEDDVAALKACIQ